MLVSTYATNAVAADNSYLDKSRKGKTIRDEAFKQMLNRTLPMRPDQIITLHKKLNESKQAVATPPVSPPTPLSSTLKIDLSPGAHAPVIRLATGFVSSVVFLDATGQPWQIADYSLGNSRDFNIQWDRKTNTMFIQSIKDYATGNMAIRLANLNTPVMLSLVNSQKIVDFRVDLHVNARGPKALAPMVDSTLPNNSKDFLISVLDGIPPKGSKIVEVSGGHGQAWTTGSKMIFRTKLSLLSPAWSAKVSSADGTKVYEFSKTPVALASKNGKPIQIAFKGI